MIKKLLFVSLISIFTGCALNFEDSTTTATAVLYAKSTSGLKVDNTAGLTSDIFIKGEELSDSIRISAKIRQLVLKNKDASKVKIKLDDIGDNRVKVGFDVDSDGLMGISVDNILARVPSRIGLDLRASSGDITVTRMSSPIRAYASSGDVTIESTKYCNVSVTSGNVVLSTEAGATVNASSGDVSMGITDDNESFQKIDIDVSSGNVQISVPRGFEAWLDLSVTSGDIIIDGMSSTRDSYRGSFNNGTENERMIKIRSTSGDIVILQY